MSRLRTLCVALFAIFALSAMATAVASAEEGFLPAKLKGFTFKSTSAKQILETEKKAKITCEGLEGSGTLVSDKHADEVDFHFHHCKALGLAAISLGHKLDEEEEIGGEGGLILIPEALALVCLLGAGVYGLIIELDKELHLEVPSTGALLLIRGSVIGKLEPIGTEPTNEFKAEFTQTGAGKQSITACVDKTNHKLETSTNGGTFEPSSEVATGTITGEEPLELMDS